MSYDPFVKKLFLWKWVCQLQWAADGHKTGTGSAGKKRRTGSFFFILVAGLS